MRERTEGPPTNLKYFRVERSQAGEYLYFLEFHSKAKTWMDPMITVSVKSPRVVEICNLRPIGFGLEMTLKTFRRMMDYIDEQLDRMERLVDLFRMVAVSYFRGVSEAQADTTFTVTHRFDWGPEGLPGSFWSIRIELYIFIEVAGGKYVVESVFEAVATVHRLEDTEYWGVVKNMFRTLAEVLAEPRLAEPPTTFTSPKFVTIHREREAFRLVRRPR